VQKSAPLVSQLADNCFSLYASIKKKKFADLCIYSEISVQVLSFYKESDEAPEQTLKEQIVALVLNEYLRKIYLQKIYLQKIYLQKIYIGKYYGKKPRSWHSDIMKLDVAC
jgi:hypothetical protein